MPDWRHTCDRDAGLWTGRGQVCRRLALRTEVLVNGMDKSRFASYIRRLGLRWKVEFEQDPEQMIHKICSDPEARLHRVILPARPTEMEVVHELCHAALAERVDPAFATLYFASSYGKLEGEEARAFYEKAQMLYGAWCHVDLWVDDLRYEHWPELALQDCKRFAQAVYGVALAKQSELLRSVEGLVGIALQIAFIERHKLTGQPDLAPVVRMLGQDAELVVDRLISILGNLPRLSFDAKRDLIALEQSVKAVAQTFGFPIEPRLVQEQGQNVWVLGEVG